ncbi:MAG: iron export ABC transporter permease subunit FetB [Actinobacteria bacterium]|nr:iron export ABC transporter permease subunit FetB [Actinomycetota bacterium]
MPAGRALAAARGTSDIGWAGLAGSLGLVAVAIALSAFRRLALERSMAWAALRALVQLLAVGAVLGFVIDPARPLVFSWLWVAAMVVVASLTVRSRAREVPGALPLALVACAAGTVVSLGVLFGLRVFPLEAKAVIPLAGLTIGNTMSAAVVASRRIVGELSDKRDEVEARLALGKPWPEAARPYIRSALRTALLPQIETTKAVGLVALPGAMTGLILAGVRPIDAVRIQAAVMYVVLGSVATSVTVISLGLARRLFTPDHRLLPLRRPAG